MTPDDHVPLPASCGPDRGRVIPVVDRNRCEGKADCVTGADDCHACGVCVEACPENAISLAPRRSN